jgi:hypothetical protein
LAKGNVCRVRLPCGEAAYSVRLSKFECGCLANRRARLANAVIDFQISSSYFTVRQKCSTKALSRHPSLPFTLIATSFVISTSVDGALVN